MTPDLMDLDGEEPQGPQPYNTDISMSAMAADATVSPITFRQALHGIKSGRWRKQVESVRAAHTEGGKALSDGPKRHLPGVVFSGKFSYRSASKILSHSGLICADLDKLGNEVAAYKERFAADPHVIAAFVSPTETGLKAIFRCDPTKPHKESFEALEYYVITNFGLMPDEKCSDSSRLCFVSYDPELFEADDATIIPYLPAKPVHQGVTAPKPTTADLMPGDDFNARGAHQIPDLLRKHGWRHERGAYWCRPGKDSGVSASLGIVAENVFHPFSDSPEMRLPSDKNGFDPFALYTHLEHGGDFKASARALGKLGFGTPSRQQKNLDRVAGPESTPPAEQLEDEEARRITLSSNPVEPTTRLFLAGKPVATPGNLVSIISKAKTGKTATIGGVVAAIVGAHFDRTDLDTFGFTAPHTKEAVILIDTEQSPFDAFTCHQRAFARAGQQADVDWMMHYALVGYDADRLRATLPRIMAKAKATHGAVFTLILDGVADFVKSVNDEAECNDFISWLRALAVQYDCPVICVIHSNEALKSGDDGRGHLGKQLTRKSESNLLLKKTGEVTVITSEKQRKAPITEADGIAFKWSSDHGRHISCEGPEDKKKGGGRKRTHDIHKFWDCIPKKGEKPLTGSQLHKFATVISTIKPQTFKDLLNEAADDGMLSRTYDKVTGYSYCRSL